MDLIRSAQSLPKQLYRETVNEISIQGAGSTAILLIDVELPVPVA